MSLTSGNYEPKKKKQLKKKADELDSQKEFEKEAIKKLGGSNAFVIQSDKLVE